MKRFFALSNIFLFLFLKMNAQVKFEKAQNADFVNALDIIDTIVGPTNVARGHGKVLDFAFDNDLREENSVWYKFTITRDTLLTFDLVPIDSTDDYDFLLFKCNSLTCIDSIRSHKKIAERMCFSQNFSKNGTTGLSEFETRRYVGVGPGGAYLAALPVKAGETYYMMVMLGETYFIKNRNYKPKGFTLYFYNFWPKKRPIVMKNVLFATNSSELLPASFHEIDLLIARMKVHKTMTMEIRGHTDNLGDEKKNRNLSEARAKAVVDYMILKGIDKKRLFYRGFGSSKPIASNDTEEGRGKNRRVEFAIVIY